MSRIPRDPYEVLGIARDASEQQIKKAFRALAMELHPDVNAHDPQAEEKFKEAAEANEILSDPERRATYDRYGHEGLRSGGVRPQLRRFGSISDLFERSSAARGRAVRARGGARPGGDVAVAVEIDLVEAANGAKVQVAIRGGRALRALPRQWRRARHADRDLRTLRRAKGSYRRSPGPPSGRWRVRCSATSAMATGACPSSRATSAAVAGARLRGVSSRSTCRRGSPTVSASGCRAADTPARRAPRAGDLYVLVRVREDERFVREGDDLIAALDVPAPLAALGATLETPTLEGVAQIEVPAGTQPGEVLTLRGEGMPGCAAAGAGICA